MQRRVTDAWGIDSGYYDLAGKWWDTLPETRRALLEAMEVDPEGRGEPPDSTVRVVTPAEAARMRGPGELQLEDGTALSFGEAEALPSDLPIGYHEWRPAYGEPLRLIVTPGRCYLNESRRGWGWAAQLYALRSAKSWGIGDLGDLRELGEWSRNDLGASMILINPLSAALPLELQEKSPYYPSSRMYRSPLYLRVEEVPGARGLGAAFEAAEQAGRALAARRQIDRSAVFRLKMDVLEKVFARFTGDPAFDRYCREQGAPLRNFAVFCALAEHHRSGWAEWPREHRRPDSEAVAQFAAAMAGRTRLHQWLQWQIDEQLRQAGTEISIMNDLPIGVDPGGADAWAWQDVLAHGVRVGAPPDPFASQGQDWGLPPFVPHKLTAARHEPFIQVIRAALRHVSGLRIDHVMGLFRLFWIPAGGTASVGTYVRYPAEDLLGILALESQRANATIVGEDLGTVEEGVRETLAARKILGYRVLWFEPRPSEYPRLALAAITTHDLPTIAGLWNGSDLEEQKRLEMAPNEEGTREIVARVSQLTGRPPDADARQVIAPLHKRLAEAPSLFVTATLDDAAGATERPNMPSSDPKRANWSLALPRTLEELKRDPLPREIADALKR
jgi:4-alpha-glucanotransferase